jgi:hypothetical protein
MCNMVAKTLENCIQYFLHLVLYSLCAFLGTVIVLRVLLSSYVYLMYLMFICCKLMCICCTLMCICCISCVFLVSQVYLLYFLCIFVVLCVLLFLL